MNTQRLWIDPVSLLWIVCWSSCWLLSLIVSECARERYENVVIVLVVQVICFCLSSLSSFQMFAIAHDTSHGSTSSIQLVNEILGRYATMFLYPAGWSSWRHMHMMHHKYTNSPEKDPDFWVVHRSKLPIPFKTWFQTYNYGIYYWKYCSGNRPFLEVLEFWIQVCSYAVAPFIFYEYGYLREALQYWILPAAVALERVAYLLDVLPHTRNDHTPQQDPFRTTSALKLSEKVLQKPVKTNPLWFSILLQFQDYHFVHHLHPSTCFHEYRTKFIEKEKFLETKPIDTIFWGSR